MPRSAKSPPPIEGPTPSDVMQKEVARIKRLIGLDINRLAIGSDIEGILTAGQWPTDYTVKGVNVTEFVNVSTSLGPAQGGSGFPAQVTGLTVTPHAGSDTQLDLTWTAITAPDFNYYNVYRGPTGFTVGPAFEIAQPVINSYQNTGLTAGTTYYYRVSVTNDAELEGAPSSQVSGTTTGTAPIAPSLLLAFDNNYSDTSGNSAFVSVHVLNTQFVTPGKFGTHCAALNWPTPNSSNVDTITVTNSVNVMPDFTNKFSVSLWIQPKDVSAIASSNGRWILGIAHPSNGHKLNLLLNTSGELVLYCTTDGSAPTRRRVGSLVNGTWYHVVITANFSTDTINLYTDKVATATTTGGPAVTASSNDLFMGTLSTSQAAQYYEGLIDELKLWNGVELTQTQVNNLFATNST